MSQGLKKYQACADPAPDTAYVEGIRLIIVVQVPIVEVEVPRIRCIVLRGRPIVIGIHTVRWVSCCSDARLLKRRAHALTGSQKQI